MRTHTTYTDIRRLMKLHNDGCTVEEISQDIFINPVEIKRIIDIRFPKKRAKKAASEDA